MNREPEPQSNRRPAEDETDAPETTGGAARAFLRRDRGVSHAEREALLRSEERSSAEIERLTARIDRFLKLVESARSLSSILDLDALLGAILQEVVGLCRVDRGFLLLSDDDHRLQIQKGFDIDSGHLEIESDTEVSRTLAEQAFNEGKLRIVSNALNREEFRTQESIQSLQLSTIVSVPLMTGAGPIGVLYLDSKRPECLVPLEDTTVLEAFSAHAAVALENARLHRELLDARAGLERENRDLRRSMPGARGLAEILGQSRVMEDLRHRIGQLQEVDSPVLIRGESGTGKDLVARALHSGSLRSSGRFQVLDCTAVPKGLMESEVFGHKRGSFTGALADKQGLFEAADEGTLFLDEIGDMPVQLQAKLLRAIEHQEFRRIGENSPRKVNVRIVSATNRNLEELIREDKFREDLYYRLKVVTLSVPPLRERGEDIILLAERFLRQNLESRNRSYTGFTPPAARFLISYPWPGNVRELKNAMEGACAFLSPGRAVDADDLQLVANQERSVPSASSAARAETRLKEYREETERKLLEEALRRCDWVVSRAARNLGISRQHLHNRIRYHRLKRPTGHPPQDS